jgi:excinuclease ABC subunit A
MPNKPSSDVIKLRGVRVHNLKDIDIDIPKNQLVVITGLSGSGKSSLAFDTIYAEGQRRYAESMSSYARQFMESRDKPDVDLIEGLSPTIAIDQKISTQNPRSTVGTVTEVYDFLRLLFARAGQQFCPNCNLPVEVLKVGEIAEEVRKIARKSTEVGLYAPLVRKGLVEKKVLVERIERSGYEWIRINGEKIKITALSSFIFEKDTLYDVDLLIGVITDIKKQEPLKWVEIANELSNGLVKIVFNTNEQLMSTNGICTRCGMTMPILDMRSFSFNSPYGACSRCTGLGITMEVDPNLVVPNPRLTIAEGAIQPWTRITGNQSWYQKVLAAVGQKYNFSLNTPIADLPSKMFDIILYGTGAEEYVVENKKTSYSGVIPDLMAKHLETNSEYVRKEIEQYMREQTCSVCAGRRLRAESLAVRVGEYNIAEISQMSMEDIKKLLKTKVKSGKVTDLIIREIIPRIENLERVGLGYLNIDRSMNTLSGGEVTRVRLATQLSSGLSGIIYVLDEPSVGLHPRDNKKLIETLEYLRDLGNTVIVVEHDGAMMHAADYLIDIGPGAGVYGGKLIAEGTLADMKKAKNSLTADYLFGRTNLGVLRHKDGKKKKDAEQRFITITGAKAHNLKNLDVSIPLGKLVCVTGVSGSGKSTLIIDILAKALTKHFYRAKEEPGEHSAIKGISSIDKVISIDQSPIGRTPRSNPATYTGIFNFIRDVFANLPETRVRGYDAGKFSFNVKGGGRCEACSGDGYTRILMQFLADVYVECGECGGQRYNQEALEVHHRGKNIADVLKMTVEEAHRFFGDVPAIADKLNVLREVGLGYITLGQPATTLSGGEAQRIKLAQELSRHSTGKTLYILDEPTTGLHFEDIKRLLDVLNKLVEKGNSVILIEHNTEVIRSSDWIIDLGPEGGALGGQVVAEGTPAELIKTRKGATAKYL